MAFRLHRSIRSALAGLAGAGLLASYAAPAQETPVGAILSQTFVETDPFGPPTGFGVSVAIEGKTAFVGAPLFVQGSDAQGNPTNNGLVEVYESDATGANWTLIDSLTPVVPSPDSFFGQSVAVSGDLLAVGSNTQIQLYEKRRGKWTPAETIPTPGANMILDGNTLDRKSVV